jgi:DNA-binding FadR family transcriptional regulator
LTQETFDVAKNDAPEASTSNGLSRRVRVPKTAELVAGQLRRQIVRGDLSEGDSLPSESVLMEVFGVSRPTLREAFRVLEAEALISIQRGSHGGARVHSPNGDVAARYAGLVLEHRGTTLADVYQARAVIEPACARILAESRSKKDLDRLWAAVEEAEGAHASPQTAGIPAVKIQHDFHSLIVELSGNETVNVLWGMLRHIIETATVTRVEHHSGAPAESHEGGRSHRRLVELIEAKDADGAEALWRKHLVETSRFLLAGASAKTVLDLLD